MNSGRLKKIIIFFIFNTLLICGILVYSRYIGTSGLKVKEYKIINKSFNDNYYGLKIVHISDIHYGRITFDKELENLVEKVNNLKPDIVVFTGDLIDKDTVLTNSKADKISSILSKIDSNIGNYAVNGNHDYKFDNWELIIENSGFINLNDKYDLIYKDTDNYILISGISTNYYGKTTINEKLKETEDFLKNNTPIYSILLMHEPDYIDEINLKNYNLVLSGHSHNGQIRLPYLGIVKQFLPKGSKKYYNEHYKIKNTDLYISGGIGTSTINFRLFDKPSINLYRFSNK